MAASLADLLDLVNDLSRISSRPLSECLAKLIAEILLDKMKSMKNVDVAPSITLMLNTEQRNFVDVFLEMYKMLDKDHFDYMDFAKSVCALGPLPIELLWRLHRPGILELSLYLTLNDSNVTILKHFSISLSDILCGRISDSELTNKIITDLCVAMLSRFMPTITFLSDDKAWTNSRKVISQVLSDATTNVMDFIYLENDEKKPISNYRYPIIYELVRKSVLVDAWLKEFCLEQLTLVLSYGPSSDALQAISSQESWTFDKSSKHLVKIFVQLLVPLSVTEAMDVLRQLVSKRSANWRATLTFVATAIVTRNDAVKELKNFIGNLLNDSFDNLDSDSLIVAFLLARQASLEGASVFPSYADWFQFTFGRLVNSMIDKKKTFTFFMEFLTNLIPYEPCCFLKIHLTRPPRVLPKCHLLYSEYAACARMRIQKLKEINKDISADAPLDEEEKTASEVDNALAMFSRLGKIPSFVMEMSIFHKAYYLGKFLKLLLKPRQLPRNPDNKMQFIDALLKASKISTTTHASYLKSCQNEGSNLVEGAHYVTDTVAFIYSISRITEDTTFKELENAMKEIGLLLVSAIDESNSKETSSLMNTLSKKVSDALNANDPNKQNYLVINLSDHHSSTYLAKVLNLLLNTFCKINISLKPSSSVKWELNYLQLLVECNPSLHGALFMRLWNLLIGKHHLRLNSVQMVSLACLVFHIQQVEHKFPSVKLDEEAPNSTFVNSVGESLSMNTEEEKLFTLKFLSGYFSAMVTEDHMETRKIPQIFIKKFDLLCAHYKPLLQDDSARENSEFRLAKLLYESAFLKKIIRTKS